MALSFNLFKSRLGIAVVQMLPLSVFTLLSVYVSSSNNSGNLLNKVQ